MENGNGSKEINNAKFKRDHSSRYRSQPEPDSSTQILT